MRLRACILAIASIAALAAKANPPAASTANPNPRVAFTTSLGSFTVEVDPAAAPATAANFLGYVRSGQYAGTLFHRVIANFMIQGGGVTVEGAEKPTRAPIVNEARQAKEKGLTNVRGALAMARTSDPNSATAQFFINVVDNPNLDYPKPDGAGYCVFGKVVDGMDTVDKIRSVKTGPGDMPIPPVVITAARMLEAGKANPKAKTKPKANP
jgi:peptidyl-prolyl cis-trans isomerase A (cyclophilin A)